MFRKNMMQIVQREENALMRASNRALWPAESTFGLQYSVNPIFMMSSERRGTLYGWKTQEVHKINEVIVDEKIHCAARRPSVSKIHDVIRTTRSALQVDNSRSSKNSWCLYWGQSPLWGWITQDVLRNYGWNLVSDAIERQRSWSEQDLSTVGLDYHLVVYRLSGLSSKSLWWLESNVSIWSLGCLSLTTSRSSVLWHGVIFLSSTTVRS